ncbi:MAG: hypothetical protein NZ602_08290 [Thermoguttaceae bacterium]|nr:hypothetical protein [Thermoguttaceae bacterium]MDW8037279.1 hypothetical protein [Thermoguttaceae bacterium]
MKRFQIRRAYRLGWMISLVGMGGLIAGGAPGAEPICPPGAKEVSAGHPLAPGIVALLEQEIRSALRDRGLETAWERFCAYSGRMLDQSSAGRGGELDGNCRLRWYDQMLRQPLSAPVQAEQFTRQLHQSLLKGDGPTGLDQAFRIVREKLDLSAREPLENPKIDSLEEALDRLQQALIESHQHYRRAIAPLGQEELAELVRQLEPVFVGQNRMGHTLANRTAGRRLCHLLEKLDRAEFLAAAETLLPITRAEFLRQLTQLPDQAAPGAMAENLPGVQGPLVRKIDTPIGLILIGGRGKNHYHLDQIPKLAALIDLGGDDVYSEGTVSFSRPVLVVVDLAGNDTYRATKPGVQGGAVLGVSLLVDQEGNDSYLARDVAQGSAIAGVGLLLDCQGDDQYIGLRRVQGQALAGLGLLLDRAGNDQYRGALWTQGFGAPLGMGILEDLEGADHYYTGGYYLDTYEETPGYEGWGQGVGAGLRRVANGGIGVLLDGGGDDVYEYDYLAHGGGYWCGMGFARDFAGNDRRLAATLKAYDGSDRTQARFQRFGTGWGCHYALGFVFDDQGDDSYGGTIMGLGMAWDDSFGLLADFGGNDRYEATGALTEGVGAQAGLGILFDYNGQDVYLGRAQGYASATNTYHPTLGAAGNFSFLIDYGGKDEYGCGAANNTITQRGTAGGFVIDRPHHDETIPPDGGP